jgi:GxxExxY protein
MGKCSNCQEEGHTIRTCQKLILEDTITISLPDEILKKFSDIVDMSNSVFRELKKGFSESVYEESLCIELQLRNIQYSTQEVIPITYKGRYVGMNRLDIILQSWFDIIIELKATSTAIKIDEQWQVVRYMSRKNYNYGVVINFNQSANGSLDIVFIINQDSRYYSYNHELQIFKELIDIS